MGVCSASGAAVSVCVSIIVEEDTGAQADKENKTAGSLFR